MTEKPSRKLIQVRLDAALLKRVDKLAVERDEHRWQTMEYLLRAALDTEPIDD